MTGQTSLEELIELIRRCKLYVSADTGPLHIANALKRPLIGLYGTTSPERTGPYGGDYVHIIVSPTSKATPEAPLVMIRNVWRKLRWIPYGKRCKHCFKKGVSIL